MKPPFVVFADEVPEVEGRYPAPFDTEGLALYREIGRAAGSERLGVSVERLLPGRQTSFMHAHLREEEGIYVLSGTPTVRWALPTAAGYGPVQETRLRPGAYVAFPAGTGIAHHLVNDGDGVAELLVIGERDPADRVRYAHFPEFEAWRAEHRPARAWEEGGGKGWPYLIKTERLRVRPWEVGEAKVLRHVALGNREHFSPWMRNWLDKIGDDDAELATLRQGRARFEREEDAMLGIFLPDGTIVGGTGLHFRVGPKAVEIGYWVDKDHAGNGYISEAVRGLVRVAFEVLHLDRVEIRMDPANTRSSAVPRRLGFRHEATLPRRHPVGDGWQDTMVWAIYRSDEAIWSPWTYAALDGLGRRLGGTLGLHPDE